MEKYVWHIDNTYWKTDEGHMEVNVLNLKILW